MRKVLAILAIVFVLPALGAKPHNATKSADIELAVGEKGELTLTSRQGQTVLIRLAGNATTGYEWTLTGQTDEKGKSCEILIPVGKIEYKPYPAKGRVGVGGNFLAMFRASKPGWAKLRFAYHRPWEKGKKPIQTFEIRLAVLADAMGS